jgi:hypothetical protein
VTSKDSTMSTKKLLALALVETIAIALGVCLVLLAFWYLVGFLD